MGIKELFRSIVPSKEDETCFYLITRILSVGSKYKARRYTNVTPGLAALLKRKYGGNYDSTQRVYYMMPERDVFEDMSCNMKDLENLLIKVKKRDYNG